MKSKSRTSSIFRFSLKSMIGLVLIAAFYLGGRESQQSTIREQAEQIDQLENDLAVSQRDRVTRAQQLANLFAQVGQMEDSLRRQAVESGTEDSTEQTEETIRQ